MQLTNIARDVGEDARAGRLYLPQAWLRDAGIDPDAFLARPAFSPALGEVVARLLAEADSLYRRADAGIAGLPGGCRPGIGAASRIYQAIGAEIAARGHDSVNHRAVVPTGRKLRLAAGTVVAPVVESEAPALPETGFLVDALRAAAAERPSRSEGVAWVLDLFLKLEERDVMQRAEGRP
jgi:phytoene synthase